MILDFSRLDTTPGATGCHAFLAPPADFTGGDIEYRRWLNHAWFNDPGIRQYLLVAATMSLALERRAPEILGPFAEGLTRVLAYLRSGKRPTAVTHPKAAAA
ncbi:MAG: hypothetical protein ACYC9L_06745 [Sulfuricaulis sp.]